MTRRKKHLASFSKSWENLLRNWNNRFQFKFKSQFCPHTILLGLCFGTKFSLCICLNLQCINNSDSLQCIYKHLMHWKLHRAMQFISDEWNSALVQIWYWACSLVCAHSFVLFVRPMLHCYYDIHYRVYKCHTRDKKYRIWKLQNVKFVSGQWFCCWPSGQTLLKPT